MRRSASVLAVLLGAGLGGALIGWIWAPFDSLAIVQPYLAAGLLLLSLPHLLPWATRGGLALLAVVGIWDVLRLGDPGQPPAQAALRHLQHNLHLGNPGDDLLALLADHDTATLQEVGEAIHVLADRPDDWHLRLCPRPGWVATAALTRLPVLEEGCTPSGAAWIRLRLPEGSGPDEALTVVSIHLFWPWPAAGGAQTRQVAGLAQEIAALPRPILLGGDFNQMPWSAAVARIAAAANGEIAGGLHATYTLGGGLLRLPIDHIVADPAFETYTTRGGRHGSDHRALTTRLTPARPSGDLAD